MIYIIGPLLWIPAFALQLTLIILGWILVPLAVMCGAYEIRRSIYWPEKYIWAFTWDIMLLWNNEEDGCLAGKQYKDLKSIPLQIIYWSALRNPCNNLRFVPILSCRINPKKVKFTGSFGSSTDKYLPKDEVMKYDTKIPQWYFASCGLYSCIYWQFTCLGLRRLWIGWSIYPTDIYDVTEYRKFGTAFNTQFKKVT
jgi:hypothetical protein